MNDQQISGVLDWPQQKEFFARDGALRDIYVLDTTIEDWKIVLPKIFDGNHGASLRYGDRAATLPPDLETLFDKAHHGFYLRFGVGGIVLDCHFFTPTEIEFSFWPEDVSAPAAHALLAFMTELGEATGKRVHMTSENSIEAAAYRYDPDARELAWVVPVTR
jgi:hypothetical protein